METPLRAFLWISLVAHVAGGALIAAGDRRTAAPAAAARPDTTSSDTLDRELWVGETFDDDSVAQASSLPAGSLLSHSVPPGAEGGRHERRVGGQEREGRGGANAESGGARFGALGDRAAIDLATAFTRGFPQAASADPAWIAAPFGDAGEARLTLRIDADGALVETDVDGRPGPALRAGIARTMALLRARTFTASGAVTRLRVVAKVAPDQVHDGLHGEVFAIGGSFEATQGSAFFALAIGRRVDLLVRVTH